MKICVITNGIVPPAHYGGTERVIDWLIRELAGLGHTIYFIGPPGSLVPLAEKSVHLDFSALADDAVRPEIRRHIPPDTDIVHDHAFYGDYGRPTLKTMHGLPTDDMKFDANFSFVSNSHRLACASPSNPFVYNGIDLDDYRFNGKKEDYFLFLGKVDWEVKGLSVALRVAKQQGLKLLIAGDFIDPAFYREKLQGELSRDIRYIGPVGGQEKQLLLSNARALLFPTLWPEPFGLVAVEALASGTPVLTTYNGAMCEIMVNGVTGFLAETVPEMARQVGMLDRIDPAACRARVADNFSSRIMAERYLRLYEQTIAAHRDNTGPRQPDYSRLTINEWLDLIDEKIAGKTIDEAVSTTEQMLHYHPHYFQGYSYLHDLLKVAGDSAKAEKVLALLKTYHEEISDILETRRPSRP